MRKLTILLLSMCLFFGACSSGDDLNWASGFFESEELLLSAEQNGKLIGLFYREGENVKAGEVLAVIDSSALVLQREQVEARLEAVREKTRSAGSEVAVLLDKREYLLAEIKRTKELLQSGAATDQQFDKLQNELRMVEGQIKTVKSNVQDANRGILSELKPLESQIRLIEDQIERCIIKSPIAGSVSIIYSKPGEMVMMGRPVVKIKEEAKMEFTAFLTAAQLAKIEVGEELTIQPVFADQENGLKGRVSWISDESEFTPKNVQSLDEQSSLVYAVHLTVPDDKRLKAGMPGRLHLKTGESIENTSN